MTRYRHFGTLDLKLTRVRPVGWHWNEALETLAIGLKEPTFTSPRFRKVQRLFLRKLYDASVMFPVVCRVEPAAIFTTTTLRRGHCFANDTLDNATRSNSEGPRSIRAISTTARGQAASKVNVIAGYFLPITLCISYEPIFMFGIMLGMLMRLSRCSGCASSPPLRATRSRRYDLCYRYFEIGLFLPSSLPSPLAHSTGNVIGGLSRERM